jgi:hypothetical protein
MCSIMASSPAQGQVILLAPLVRPRAWGWSQLSYYLLRPFVKGIARRFSENSNDPDFLPFLQADPLQPLRCRPRGSARWRAGSNASKPHRRAPTAADRAGAGGHDRGLAAQLAGAEGQVRSAAGADAAEARHHLANETPALRGSISGF